MKKTIYDMKFILSISFVIIACAILLSFIYDIILVRICLFVAFICYVVYYAHSNLSAILSIMKKKGIDK